MAKRPTKTAARLGRSIPDRMPAVPEIPPGADTGPALSDELRNPLPQHGLTLEEATRLYVPHEAASTLPVAPAEAEPAEPVIDATGSPLSADDAALLLSHPQGRRSAKAIVPILADGTLYLPGTDTEMVPLTFEAYGELVSARLIEPVPWGSLDVVSANPIPAGD